VIGLDVVVMASVLANAAGAAAAALVVYWHRARQAGPRLLSFVVGSLLGAVLLDLLPHLWEATGSVGTVAGLIAAALVLSALFDRVCACAHQRSTRRAASGQPCHTHMRAASSRSAGLLMLGDFVHSLVDGVLIGTALAVGILPGALATIAIAIHEVPRRVATVTLLTRAGWRPVPALAMAVFVGTGTVLGGILTWWTAETVQPALPAALALSAAAMLYVAVAQSAHLLRDGQARLLSLECTLPFVAGLSIIAGSHHALGFFG
jgi:zinc and cadmium transporter